MENDKDRVFSAPRTHGPVATGYQCDGYREVLDQEEYDDVEVFRSMYL